SFPCVKTVAVLPPIGVASASHRQPWEGGMTDTTAPAAAGRTPVHLWIVGVVSLLWNGFGGYDFVMSLTRGEAYWRESGMTQAMIDYYNAMPVWMYVPWILGVWGAVLGSVLLLLRMRLAVHAFALSLLGAVLSLIYGLVNIGRAHVLTPVT